MEAAASFSGARLIHFTLEPQVCVMKALNMQQHASQQFVVRLVTKVCELVMQALVVQAGHRRHTLLREPRCCTAVSECVPA